MTTFPSVPSGSVNSANRFAVSLLATARRFHLSLKANMRPHSSPGGKSKVGVMGSTGTRDAFRPGERLDAEANWRARWIFQHVVEVGRRSASRRPKERMEDIVPDSDENEDGDAKQITDPRHGAKCFQEGLSHDRALTIRGGRRWLLRFWDGCCCGVFQHRVTRTM